ncbi:hypothetical protein BDR22DRAFT_126373 [Usnea florida]
MYLRLVFIVEENRRGSSCYNGLVPCRRDLMMAITLGKEMRPQCTTHASLSSSVLHNPDSTNGIEAPLALNRTLYLRATYRLCHRICWSSRLSVKVSSKMASLEQELDPAIWSNVNHDILLNIIEQSDLPTLINWSCTSRAIFPIASCNIWASLRVRSSDITAYISIVYGHRFTNRSDSVLHFLLESAYRRHTGWNHIFASNHADGVFIHRPHGVEKYVHERQRIPTLPVSRIKRFEIDNQGFDEQHPICNQIDMDCVLSTLLKRLSALQSFKYLGPLSDKGLAAILQVHSLRVLQVRTGNDILKVQVHQVRMPWIDRTLNWTALGNLKCLESLEIGRLICLETPLLAIAVASLKLRRLHLSCWGWEFENVDASHSWGANNNTSALVLFLDAITTLYLDGDQKTGGLPPTLQHLVLVDKYHTQIPSLYQLVATAILPCEKLESLSTTISVNGRCYDRISKMGLPSHHKIVGLKSWKQLSCEEGMKVLHQYQGPSGEILQTDPYPKPLSNIVRSLDQAIAGAERPASYRMSMKFVKQDQFRSDEIIVYPCEGVYNPCAAELGPQAQDEDMIGLVARFRRMLFAEMYHSKYPRFRGPWA